MSTNIQSARGIGNVGTTDSLSIENRQKLSDLAAEFESMLLNHMLREMTESGKWSSLGESGLDTLGAQTFDQTFQVELSRYLAKAGGLGLSQQLMKAFDAVSGADGETSAAPGLGAFASASAPSASARTGWNGLVLDAPAYGGSGAEWAGFNNDRALAGGDDGSVKDAFFRWTYGQSFNPAGKSKAEIAQFLRGNIDSAREYGLNILDVEEEKILIETRENGPEWIDTVVAAGSTNPAEVKWQWLPVDDKPVSAAALANSATAPAGTTLSSPASAVTSAYGWRNDPFTGEAKFHNGIDFRAPEGSEIASAGAGRVTFAGSLAGYGNTVVVQHANGLSTRYAHLSELLVQAGDSVTDKQIIGRAGQTGRATAAHLHFEVLVGGVPVDPSRLVS
jgi:murein DD-endopeptidase MepM/ murein hydrolase activator NlpD